MWILQSLPLKKEKDIGCSICALINSVLMISPPLIAKQSVYKNESHLKYRELKMDFNPRVSYPAEFTLDKTDVLLF